MALKKLSALLIDPDIEARMRLKTITGSVIEFGLVEYSQSLSDALQKVGTGSVYDVVFVSNRIPEADFQAFIKKAKETQGGQDTAFVLVLSTNNQGNATVAKNVIGGADGFLFEPYSVDNVMDTTFLATRVKKERSFAREKAALGMLVKDIIPQLDQLAYLKSCKMDTARGLKKLEEFCSPIRNLTAELLQVYFEEAVINFSFAPVPKNISKFKKYGGVSDRIKKRMEKKVQEEFDSRLTK